MTIGMGDKLFGDDVDAALSASRAGNELGKTTVAAAAEITIQVDQLLFNEMEIIDNPFRGWRDPLVLSNLSSDLSVTNTQHATIVAKTVGEAVRTRC